MNVTSHHAAARPPKLYVRFRDRIGQPRVLRVLEPTFIAISAALLGVATFSAPIIPSIALVKIFVDTQINANNGTGAAGGNLTSLVKWTTVQATVGLWGYCSEGITYINPIDNSTSTIGAGCSVPGTKWSFDPGLAGYGGLSNTVNKTTTGLLVVHMFNFALFVISAFYWIACQVCPSAMNNVSFLFFKGLRAFGRIVKHLCRRAVQRCTKPKRVIEYQDSARGRKFNPAAPTERDLPSYIYTLHKRAPRNLFLYFTLLSFLVFFLDIILSGIVQHNFSLLAPQLLKADGTIRFEGGNSLAIQLLLLIVQIWVITLLTIDVGKTKEEYVRTHSETQEMEDKRASAEGASIESNVL